MIAVLIHIYYADSWQHLIRDILLPLRDYPTQLFVNLVDNNNNVASLCSKIREQFPDAIIISTPNKGKDIGGKLALLEVAYKMNFDADLMVFLHDKRSPQALHGERWRMQLFEILNPDKIKQIISDFDEDAKLGIVGPASLIKNEYSYDTHGFISENAFHLKTLVTELNVQTSDYRFVAGTMFWTRYPIFRSFFSTVSPLACRERLEAGNVMDDFQGSFTHAWERLLCWIVTGRNFGIKGI